MEIPANLAPHPSSHHSHRMKVRALFWILVLAPLISSAQTSQAVSQYQDNATFLSHNYMKYSSYVNLVPTLASQMGNTYKVMHWFNNAGVLTSAGMINNASTELAQVKNYMKAVHTYEAANGVAFKLYAWLSADPASVDISNPAIRSAIAQECQKLTLTTVPGSYLAGANRAFDGVILDLEPSGNNDALFNNYMILMDGIRSSIGGGNLTGVAAEKLATTTSQWYWSPSYYSQMAQHVDVIVDMAYDTGLGSGGAYQNWMESQTTSALQAVSGTNATVFMGIPAYPANATHDPAVENIPYAVQGIEAGITDLNVAGDTSVLYFHGTALYLHSDGSGSDGFAGWVKDWNVFANDWLGWGPPPSGLRLRKAD